MSESACKFCPKIHTFKYNTYYKKSQVFLFFLITYVIELRNQDVRKRDARDCAEAEDDLNAFRKKFKELQGGDLNPRPPGYEPDELPGCSTLRQELLS